jgi:CheY-like chemotaxis protein
LTNENGNKFTGGKAINSGDQVTILLIDDNAVQAATRQAILKRAGHFVIAVLNPVRALEQFRRDEYPAKIGLVITDHLMPGMNGAEFVKALRETHPNLPVLVISGLEEAEEEYRGLNVQFRLKPVLPDLLIDSVQKLIADGSMEKIIPGHATTASGVSSGR